MANDPDWYSPPTADHAPSPNEDGDYGETEPAGFAVRFGARFIDVIAVTLLGAVGGAVGGILTVVLSAVGVKHAGLQRSSGLDLGPLLTGAIAGLVYHAVAEGVGGATVGKALLGLRVKREEDFAPCGIWRGLGRNLAYYIDAFFFGLVAYSSMSNSRMQQRLGDKWASTVVVRAKSLPASAAGGVALGMCLGMAGHVLVSAIGVVIRVL